jgi:hypothetical protein
MKNNFKIVHDHFFTKFNINEFIENFEQNNNLKTKEFLKLSESFKNNLLSTIRVIEIPVTISQIRTRLYIFDKFLSRELILNAPEPGENRNKKQQQEIHKKCIQLATDKFLENLKSKKGKQDFYNITFQFIQDCYNSNQKFDSTSNELMRQTSVLLWTAFEVLVRDCVTLKLNQNSKYISKDLLKSISIEFLEEYDFNLKQKMGEIYSRNIDWSNYGMLIKSLDIFNNSLSRFLKSNSIWKLNQRRHLIVHKKGIIDKYYLDSTNDNFKVGSELIITPEEFKIHLEDVKTAGLEMLNCLEQIQNSS